MDRSLERIAKNIEKTIDDELARIGILYRIFSRAKTSESIELKQKKKQYGVVTDKKMQDLIGIRVTLYFRDDIDVVNNSLQSIFKVSDETIDESKEALFEPTRHNVVYNLSEDRANEIKDLVLPKYEFVDTTFEVQLRTVLSEGWHEVDHDLRYKCEEDWEGNLDLSRIMNGINATLETTDWSILSLFEKLAHRHYKNKNWQAMLRNHFRLRLRSDTLESQVIDILDNNQPLAKDLYRIERKDFLNSIFKDDVRIPLSFSNLVFLLNVYFLKDLDIKKITPKLILDNRKIMNNW